MPEYFLVPLGTVPDSIGSITQVKENFGTDPVLSRGYGANYNDTAYPFYPGNRPGLSAGRSESWFFGEPLAPTAATVLLSTPATAGTSVRFGLLAADGSTRWGRRPRSRPVRPRPVRRCPRGSWVGLSLQVLGGSIPSHRVVVTADGAPYELGGSLSSALMPGAWRVAGFSQGYAVFTSVKPSKPISAVTAGGHARSRPGALEHTKSEEIRVRAPTAAVVIRSVAWDAGWKGTVSVNGGPARSVTVQSHDLVQQIRVPAGDDRGDLPLPAAASLGGQRAQHRGRGCPPRTSRRLAIVRRRRRGGPTERARAGEVTDAQVSDDQHSWRRKRCRRPSGADAEPEVPAPSVLERDGH